MTSLTRHASAIVALVVAGTLTACGAETIEASGPSAAASESAVVEPGAAAQDGAESSTGSQAETDGGGGESVDGDSTDGEPAEGVLLFEMPTVGLTTPWSPGAAKVDTKVFSEAMTMSLPCGRAGTWRFDLNRGKGTFAATAGLSDRTSRGSTSAVQILVDGEGRGDFNLEVGKPSDVRVPVSGGLQLEVRATSGGCQGGTVEVVFGQPRLLD